MQFSAMKKIWRQLWQQKLYFIINVIGLSLGIASAVLILLWIVDECSFEKQHENAEHIRQIHKQYSMGGELQVNPSLPGPLGPTLTEAFPEIVRTVRIVPQRATVRNGDRIYQERNICAADTGYFRMFSFTFLAGDPATALSRPGSVVLTREMAQKYFGDEDALGKTLRYEESRDLTVSAVIDSISGNTIFDFQAVVPFDDVYGHDGEITDWHSHFVRTYIQLDPNAATDSLSTRLTRHMRSYLAEDAEIELFAHPLRDLHLHDPGSRQHRAIYVYIFSFIALLVLLLACINFTTASTIVALKRSREIGIRKINGGSRPRLIRQFFGEAFQQTFPAFLLAMMLVELLRPLFNQLTGKQIVIPYLAPWFFLGLAGLLALTTFLSGIYPAVLISAFRPVDAFRGRVSSGRGQARFRTGLLVFQFTITIGLLVTTLMINRQLGYMQKKNLGFEKENLVYVPLEDLQREHYDVFREEVVSHPGVLNMCRSSSLPTEVWNIMRGLTWEGYDGEEMTAFAFVSVDENFVETMGLEVIEGRNFSKDFPGDADRYMVNEEAARFMGFEQPVGKAFVDDSLRTEIIGMFGDFHGLPLTEAIEPMLFTVWPDYYFYALIRLTPGDPRQAMDHLEKSWAGLYPDIPFVAGFVDERIDRQYRSERRVGRLAGVFTLLALLITGIGLFAISGHSARSQYKQIGIRKAMGASVYGLVLRFILQNVRWVLLASLFSWPLAWLFVRDWLDHFAFRTGMAWWIFLLATALSVLISVLTVAWHAWQVARSNPVAALRHD